MRRMWLGLEIVVADLPPLILNLLIFKLNVSFILQKKDALKIIWFSLV